MKHLKCIHNHSKNKVTPKKLSISLLLRIFLVLACLPAVLLSTGGCIKTGPDYARPRPDFEVPEAYFNDPGEPKATLPEDQWWMVFGNPDLNRLVYGVLQNNLDIKKAAASILEIQSMVIQAKAGRLPSLNLQGQGKRQQQIVETNTPVIDLGPPPSFSTRSKLMRLTTDTFNLAVSASFELDLWGRLARTHEAALADLLQVKETRQIIVQSVLAEAISLYFQIESLEKRVEITNRGIDNYSRSLALVERRYEHGLTSILDLRQARRILAQAKSSLPLLRQELGISQYKLSVLLGKYPAEPYRESGNLHNKPVDPIKKLSPVPPGLPSELLLRRPDIRAAEEKLKALNARVGAAKAGRFPRITLTGMFGYVSDSFSRLIMPKNELWNLAAGLTQPIFDAGRLKASQKSAEARYQQGLAEYAKTVLSAFAEVESALLTRKEQFERRKQLQILLEEARATQDVAESRYKRGLVNYLTVLDAQQNRFKTEESMVLADLAILTNRIALHRSLGGGWKIKE